MTLTADTTSSPSPEPAAATGRLQVTAYLAGAIKKGRDDDRPAGTFWSDLEEYELLLGAGDDIDVTRLNPAKTSLRRQDYLANYGAELHLVSISDVVVVDARTERGIGLGAEMMFARAHEIPVVTVCPPNSNYRRDRIEDLFGEDVHDWTHPFIAGLSDYIVDDFRAAGRLVADAAHGRLHKRCPHPADAVAYFLHSRGNWATPPAA